MKNLFRRPRMFIRTYRKPIQSPLDAAIRPGTDIEQPQCKEMFVLLEQPLLEMDREDLLFLKGCGISVTAC